MSSNETKIPFRRMNQIFFVSLAGANLKLEKILRESCQQSELFSSSDPFFYYEYLLHQPYKREDNPKSHNAKSLWYFAPFLLRLAKKTNVVYDVNKMGLKLARRIDLLNNLHLAQLDQALWMKEVLIFWETKYEQWHKDSTDKPAKDGDRVLSAKDDIQIPLVVKGKKHPPLEPRRVALLGEGFFYVTVPKYTVRFAREGYIQNQVTIAENKEVDDSKRISALSRLIEDAFRRGYLHTIPESDALPTLVIPLATHQYFYGELIVSFPGLNLTKDKLNSILLEIARRLMLFVLEQYLPAVIMTHQHFLESSLTGTPLKKIELNHKVCIKGKDSPLSTGKLKYSLPWCSGKNPYKAGKEPSYNAGILENALFTYWSSLKKGQNDQSKDNGASEKLRVFQNYHIASDDMIKLLIEIIRAARNLNVPSNARDSLPTCLIVGTSGSGKDRIPELLRAFSRPDNGFNNAEIKKINMAGLKPDDIVSPVFSGVELMYSRSIPPAKKIKLLSVEGILSKVASEAQNRKGSIILVLDELNSMHVDVQGVLLRFLENSEVVKLGQLPTRNMLPVKCLVIGIMNEDPEELSREKSLKFLEREKYLGGLIRDVLYEQFIAMRRLRPDLKYRLIRGGYFNLSNINERRSDIPVLFFVSVKKEIKEMKIDSSRDVVFDIGFVEKLLSPEIDWSGNVRQIQVLAKKTLEIVQSKPQKTDFDPQVLYFFLEDLIQAWENIGRGSESHQ